MNRALNITIDPHAGFCFGVVNSITKAEENLAKNKNLYCLGDIVHNNMEVERLSKMGMEVITHEQLKTLRNAKVLIRAHGEPPETYQLAKENNIELIDASCPVVLKLQQRIKKGFEQTLPQNGQLVIFGKAGHAEVVGLEGQTGYKAIVVSGLNDLNKIDFRRPVTLFSQTTQSPYEYQVLCENIEQRLKEENPSNPAPFHTHDTICRKVANREPWLKDFASNHDICIFVSGKKSSNGLFLFSVCKSTNPHSFMISSSDELKREWFENAQSVGISGATSTPLWLMQEIAEKIKTI